MTDTVQFNIGGTPYKVSRSILESHPNTMLAKSATVQWQEDPEAEIFIERNGNRFQYVLDYMRDGKVVLPVTESKESLLADLEYYGVEADESEVSDTSTKQAICLESFGEALRDLNVMTVSEGLDYRCSKYAFDIITTYMLKVVDLKGAVTLSRGDGKIMRLYFTKKDQTDNLLELCKMGRHADVLEKANLRLSSVGLQVTGFHSNPNNYTINNGHATVKCVDPVVENSQE